MTEQTEHLGRVAYEAYVEAVGGVSVHGEPLPTWDEQRERNTKVAAAWCRAANTVAAEVRGETGR